MKLQHVLNKMKNKSELIISLISIVVLELILYGVNQIAFNRPYSNTYIAIPALFTLTQIMYCLNLDKFFSSNAGVRMFFIYKACKFFFIICPLLIYIFVAKDSNVWIPVRTSVYYFVFLVEETLMSLKYQH